MPQAASAAAMPLGGHLAESHAHFVARSGSACWACGR